MKVVLEHMPGFSVAALRHVGPYETLPETNDRIHDAWRPESGRSIDGPLLLIYLNDPGQTPPEKLETRICVPLGG